MLLALLYRAGNDDGVVTAQYAVTLAQLAGDAKVSERTARRALDHAFRHGWWVRLYAGKRGGRIAARLSIGQDCDCSGEATATCEVCAKPLAGKRADARTCGGRCRVALHRSAARLDSKRYNDRTESVTSVDSKRYMSRQIGVTVTAPKCYKSQVTHGFSQEISEEEEVREEPRRDPWFWWRGTPDFGPQIDDADWR